LIFKIVLEIPNAMGKPDREIREPEIDRDTDDELGDDSFEPLLREIARDSSTFSERFQPVSSLPVEGDVIAKKFKIERCLGTGGMGAVFSATHLVTQKRVAIKWMLPAQSTKKEALPRFIREARAAGRIDHPNVVDVYDFGKHARGYYLVMELLHGEPLSARMQGNYACPYAEAIALLMPVMRGVAAAHAAGVVHRDLKPANIFLCKGADGSRREPKVLDFGISKFLPQSGQAEQFDTTDSVFVGTPSYAAPERLRANQNIDCKADVYALGVILYELIAGRSPFRARDFGELLVEIASGSAEPLFTLRPDVPVELNNVIMKSMAREPDRRYPDVRSLALALEPYTDSVTFDSGGNAAARSTNLFTAIQQKRSIKLSIAAAFVVVLAATTIVWVAPKIQVAHTSLNKLATSKQAVHAAPLVKPVRGVVEKGVISGIVEATSTLQKTASAVPSAPLPKLASSATAIQEKSRTSHDPAKKNAAMTREVLFVNSCRALVKATVKCPIGPIEITMPARSKTTFSVPNQNCKVTCRGAGEPVCPITLSSNAHSLTIF